MSGLVNPPERVLCYLWVSAPLRIRNVARGAKKVFLEPERSADLEMVAA